ncbi:inner centromere protein-like isoform X2 [Notamacropus eugenii]|uniref:inner centromere protein-like isoform X2 n=1 Tax=Notamacropus eugenii TaxID=9315 RepID=UPI003B66DBAB
MDQGEEPRKPPQSMRQKRSYKQAVSEPGEKWDHMDDEALSPCTKTAFPLCPGCKEQYQHEEQEPKKLQKEQEKKAKEAKVVAAAAGASDRWLDETTHVQSAVCNSYEMTPQDPKGGPKTNPDNCGMDLNSDDSTDDEFQHGKPIPAWATGSQLRQAIIHQYYLPPDTDQLFGTILSPDLEDIFKQSQPRYHTHTSSAFWDSPPLPES